MSEDWVQKSIFCPNCGSVLNRFPNNTPAGDFFCDACPEEYELKSSGRSSEKRVPDGAYQTMIERITSNHSPNFFFLTYDKASYRVKNFLVVPKYFFVEGFIEKRKPLAKPAQRHGWVGCTILMQGIPALGKIYYIRDGVAQAKEDVLGHWDRTNFVKRTTDIDAKGWMLDVLTCVERIRGDEFTLEQVYQFEGYLQSRHPGNNNVKAKIRQQLQYLRDRDVLEFVERGNYRLLAS